MAETGRNLELKRWQWAVGLALVGIMSLAGCAGSETGKNPDPSPGPTASPSATALSGISTETGALPSATPFLRPTSIITPTVKETPDAIAAVVNEAAASRGVSPADIVVLLFDEQTWSSTALGCPEPGRSYAQIVTSGYDVLLVVAGDLVTYHVNLTGTSIVECGREDLE